MISALSMRVRTKKRAYPDRETARTLMSAVSAGALVVGLCDVA